MLGTHLGLQQGRNSHPNVFDFQNFSPKSLLPVVKGTPAVKTFTALWIPRPDSAVTGSVKASAGVACAGAGAGAGALGALDAVGIAGAVTRRGERPRRPNCESGAMSGVNGVGILSKGNLADTVDRKKCCTK